MILNQLITETMSTKTFNILYVDDERDNLLMFDLMYKREFNIRTEQYAAKAIEEFQHHDINLLVTDQKMPDMLGTDLIKQLKAKKPNLKTIILTGYADTNMLMTAINECHVDYVVNKPFDNEHLYGIIRKIEDECFSFQNC